MQLRKIGKIRQHIDRHTCACVVNSLVTSRIDLNNALLAKAPATLINRRQLSQKNAARLVSGTKRGEHITPVLRDLHWLPVSARIVFKVLVLTYKCLNCAAFPQYLQSAADGVLRFLAAMLRSAASLLPALLRRILRQHPAQLPTGPIGPSLAE